MKVTFSLLFGMRRKWEPTHFIYYVYDSICQLLNDLLEIQDNK